jgi:hypothetical protein
MGRPGIPLRLITGLHLLKHIYALHILAQSGGSFWFNPADDSGLIRSPVLDESDW